jgi:hypothetical protein
MMGEQQYHTGEDAGMKDEEDGGRERLLGVLLARCAAEEDGDRPAAGGDLVSSLRVTP